MAAEAAGQGSSNDAAAALTAQAALLAVVVAARCFLRVEPCDDALLVLTVVRNGLAGSGPHLLAGGDDAVLSTFLWPLLLALPTALGVDPVLALRGLGLAAECLLALVAFRLTRALSGSVLAATIATAGLITNPVYLLPSHGGMETPLVLALLAAAALACANRRPAELALACALLPWARLDGTLAAVVFLFYGAFSSFAEDRGARRMLALGGAGAASAFVAHRVVFGLWLPTSITAKAAVAAEAGGAGAFALAREFAKATIGESSYWLANPTPHALVLVFSIYGVFRLSRERNLARALAALLLWSAAYVGVFVLSGRGYATNFPWYFAPPLLVFAVLAAVGLAPACGRLERRAGPRASVALAAAAALAVALVVAPAVGAGIERVRLSFTAHRERAYAAAALWLARHGPVPSVASNEIGALAWFSPPGTEIVDLFGLARREPDRGVEWTELVARRRPVAIVTRADFRYRRTLEAERPGEWLWIRAGALDLGLEPALAERLRPHQDDLVTIYRQLDLGRSPR